jgi:hypothetical protein
MDVLIVAMLDSFRAMPTSLPHRFRERVCTGIHVALRRRDTGATGAQLRLVNRNAVACES